MSRKKAALLTYQPVPCPLKRPRLCAVPIWVAAPGRGLLGRLASSRRSIDAHRHDDHQVAYAARGVLSITTDAGSWIAPPTRAIWVPAGTTHAHRAYGGLELHLVGITTTTGPPPSLPTPAVVGVSPLLRELILECTRTADDESADPAAMRLRAVLLDQLRSAERPAEHLPAPTSSLLRAVCEGMAADPSDGRTLADWGREVGAAERTLSRLFRAELGLTFPQWRTRLRLHHALVLLSDGLPVTTVAHRCGWASASAFIDVFRRTFGYTPGSRPTPKA